MFRSVEKILFRSVCSKHNLIDVTRIKATSCNYDHLRKRLYPSDSPQETSVKTERRILKDGPDFDSFLRNAASTSNTENGMTESLGPDPHPYIEDTEIHGQGCSVYLETYGCQMNVSDTEIVRSILLSNGYTEVDNYREADIAFVMTCSIRDSAEEKIRKKLHHFKTDHKRRRKMLKRSPLKIGVLGCMAERLKEKLVANGADIVAGPDAYRDLPRLIAATSSGQSGVNVQLSLEETYADIAPVRMAKDESSAYVSIMRGCDNMCTYCIVPFTRGRERSRPIDSILSEVRSLSQQGVKEVWLLGQNVNSYRDLSESQFYGLPDKKELISPIDGFRTVYRPKIGGRRFAELLDRVSLIDPEMRVRFTAAHPKDFPMEVLQLIRERRNICNQIHLPAQSGSSKVLEAMGRGYTREAYLQLVDDIRGLFGSSVALTSDFIAGFCGETERDHKETLELMRTVSYEYCFCFPYSMREKTRAHRRLQDDVSWETKKRRANELIDTFREIAKEKHAAENGDLHLVLVEGASKRSSECVAGRNDYGTRVIVENEIIPSSDPNETDREMLPGDYVAVQITGAGTSQILRGKALYRTSLSHFYQTLEKTEADPTVLSSACLS